jgi:hypothetical protein
VDLALIRDGVRQDRHGRLRQSRHDEGRPAAPAQVYRSATGFDSTPAMGQPCRIHGPSHRTKVIAKRKGTVAAAATGGSLAVMFLINPVLGVLGLAGSAFLGYDWFKFRAKNGMRF